MLQLCSLTPLYLIFTISCFSLLYLFQKLSLNCLKPLWTVNNPWSSSILYSGDTSKGKTRCKTQDQSCTLNCCVLYRVALISCCSLRWASRWTRASVEWRRRSRRRKERREERLEKPFTTGLGLFLFLDTVEGGKPEAICTADTAIKMPPPFKFRLSSLFFTKILRDHPVPLFHYRY